MFPCFSETFLVLLWVLCASVDGSWFVLCSHYSANACLIPVCSLHGLAVTTVEALGSTKTCLHQIQVLAHTHSWCS